MKIEPNKPKAEVKTQEVSFEPFNINRAPTKIIDYAENNKSAETATLLEDGGRFWALLTRGVKPTGGYSVKVYNIKLETGEAGATRLRVLYKYTDPAPDQFVTQVLTTPVELVRLQILKKRPDEVVFIKG